MQQLDQYQLVMGRVSRNDKVRLFVEETHLSSNTRQKQCIVQSYMFPNKNPASNPHIIQNECEFKSALVKDECEFKCVMNYNIMVLFLNGLLLLEILNNFILI